MSPLELVAYAGALLFIVIIVAIVVMIVVALILEIRSRFRDTEYLVTLDDKNENN